MPEVILYEIGNEVLLKGEMKDRYGEGPCTVVGIEVSGTHFYPCASHPQWLTIDTAKGHIQLSGAWCKPYKTEGGEEDAG